MYSQDVGLSVLSQSILVGLAATVEWLWVGLLVVLPGDELMVGLAQR